MICNNCGNIISDDSKFCNKCGHNVTVENSQLETNFAENNTPNNSFTNVENVSNESTQQPVKTKNNNVTNTILIVAIIVVLLGTIGFFVNKLMFKEGADTNKTTDTVIEDTNIEDTNNYEIGLTKTYTNIEKNISFNYPETWEIVDSSQEIYDVIVALTASTDENFPINMHIANTDTSTYINYFNNKEKVPELYALDGSDVKEVASIKIDDIDAIKVISNAPDNSTGIQYFYNFNDDGYVITLYAPTANFDEYEPIFDSIMESYKITSTTEDTILTEDAIQIEDVTKTEDTTQNQNSADDGLSEAEALSEVQKFINTYPLLELKITGYVEDSPQLSSTEVYSVEVIAPDGSHWSLLVNKITGKVFISSDSADVSTIVEGEALYKHLYDELFVSNKNENVILFNGKKIANYLGTSISSIDTDFGPPINNTDIVGLDNVPRLQANYKNIGFIYNTDSIIELIIGNPEMFTYNGVTLDKNSDELADLIGEPIIDTKMYSDMYGTYVYCTEYLMDNYEIRFTFKDEDSNACLISFIK